MLQIIPDLLSFSFMPCSRPILPVSIHHLFLPPAQYYALNVQILVYGQSVGSGPSCYLASTKPVAGTYTTQTQIQLLNELLLGNHNR